MHHFNLPTMHQKIPKGISTMLSKKNSTYLASHEASLSLITPSSSVKRSVLAMSMRFIYDTNPPPICAEWSGAELDPAS